MSDDEKKGIYLPSWIWSALQAALSAAVIGGYGMFYSMHSDLTELKLKMAAAEQKDAELTTDLRANSENESKIREDVASIKAELPHIKGGVEDIKSMLRSR
jgi:hypothetical protein